MPNTLDTSYLKSSVFQPGIFDGKVAFITGGAGTICRVQAEALVLLGANVAILGRSVDKTETAAREISSLRSGAKVIGLGGVDVRKIGDLSGAVAKTVEALGRIDFVICGAAGNFLSDFNHLSANAYKAVIEIDLLGSYNTAKATFEEVKKTKGQYLFVSATLHYGATPMQAHAMSAKAGVDTLNRSLAVELGPLGIRSNVIAPGPIEGTEGMDRLMPDQEMHLKSLSWIPLQRYGTTREIADATVFVLSPASSYTSGQIIVVDGGQWMCPSPGFLVYPEAFKVLGESDGKL